MGCCWLLRCLFLPVHLPAGVPCLSFHPSFLGSFSSYCSPSGTLGLNSTGSLQSGAASLASSCSQLSSSTWCWSFAPSSPGNGPDIATLPQVVPSLIGQLLVNCTGPWLLTVLGSSCAGGFLLSANSERFFLITLQLVALLFLLCPY